MWRAALVLPTCCAGSCWSGVYTAELCCDVATYGSDGNPICWEGDFTYERCCCSDGHCLWVDALSTPLGPPPEMQGVGLFLHYEPGKDCWTGSWATFERCCDLSISALGDQNNCWDNNLFTFERCCFKGEAGLGQKPSRALRPALLAEPTTSEGPAPRPVGRECWVGGFSYAACCLGGLNSCWDHYFTQEACCEGRPQLPQVGVTVSSSDPQAECLEVVKYLTLDLEQRPRQCPQRYFYLASMATPLIGVAKGLPWWMPKTDLSAKPLRPHRLHFTGGICVPWSCSEETVARFVAPLVVPWWRSPRPTLRPLNASHVALPPPLAAAHKVYPVKAVRSFSMWTALRPSHAEALCELDRWDFAMIEHRKSFMVSRDKLLLLAVTVCTICGLNSVNTFQHRQQDGDHFLSPQFHMWRLGLARGPKHLEVFRLILTLIVVCIHLVDHGPWTPLGEGSACYVLTLRSCLSRVNVGFVVLMVHLSISRRSLKQAPTVWSWLKQLLFHTVKRWFVIGPTLLAWSGIFIHMPFVDVPMNNILKSHPLYLWYGERREACDHWPSLLSSALLMHGPIMGEGSPCHNTDIFESLFQIDVVVFAMLTSLGRARAGFLAHLLWVLAVAWSYYQMQLRGSHASFNGTCHTFASLLPSALATLAISSWLPKHELPMARAHRPRLLLSFLASLGILVACLHDEGSKEELTFPWPQRLRPLVEWQQSTMGLDYVIPAHGSELLLVFGLLVHLKQGWGPQRQEPWSGLRALARMSMGVCIANLFVLHLLGAYLYEEPVAFTVFSFLAHILMVLVCSVLVSVPMHLVVEGPFACMLTDGLPPVHRPPAAAAAA